MDEPKRPRLIPFFTGAILVTCDGCVQSRQLKLQRGRSNPFELILNEGSQLAQGQGGGGFPGFSQVGSKFETHTKKG